LSCLLPHIGSFLIVYIFAVQIPEEVVYNQTGACDSFLIFVFTAICLEIE
jgi:hypothetical protein